MEKIVPYKDRFLTFYNYKEPLKKVSNGFGYMGVLLGTIEGDQVQCHICGELFADMARHVIGAHKDVVESAHDYKTMFGLAYETALISESERDRRKLEGMRAWKAMSVMQRTRLIAQRKRNFKKYLAERGARQPKITLETKNKRGTCPEQLLEKITACAKAIGHSPSKKDFIDYYGGQRFYHLIKATFGEWKRAIEKAGLEVKKAEKRTSSRRKYSNDELLDTLSNFYQETGKIPSHTDARRGLIPDSTIYVRRFGSLPKARALAGIYETPSRWSKK